MFGGGVLCSGEVLEDKSPTSANSVALDPLENDHGFIYKEYSLNIICEESLSKIDFL